MKMEFNNSVNSKDWVEFNNGNEKKGVLPNGIKYVISEFYNPNPPFDMAQKENAHRLFVSFDGDDKYYPWDSGTKDHYIVYTSYEKCTMIYMDIIQYGWDVTEVYPSFSKIPYMPQDIQSRLVDESSTDDDLSYCNTWISQITSIGVADMSDEDLNLFVNEQVKIIEDILRYEGLIQ